ncbi:transporter substrate-binding domain-containing protein [Pseudomonas sp. MWU13-3659]|uniref:ATP-binding protein n=1 Tax=Pseudomonas sp. MWU13-3659 TaxID=2986964 RepID=UPI002075039F|nr:transporter substrate-binding domain-containing protein [Pseudomonas sp. MWU13-3659]
MRRYVSRLLVIVLLALPFAALAQEGELLPLYGRSQAEDFGVNLDEADWAWLRSKKRLVLGVSAPDYAPFEVTANAQGFEGITADYIGLIGQMLHMKIEVRRYATRLDLISALKRGEIDLVGTANVFDAAEGGVVLSRGYAEDQPVLVTRSTDNDSLGSHRLEGRRIAMLYHYLPPDEVKLYYPDAQLQLYPSNFAAIGAVAFGQADVYLGDAISASHLINRNYLNNVQIGDFSRVRARDFSFAMRSNDLRLQSIVDATIDAIPGFVRAAILRRWDVLRVQVPGLYHLDLSSEEKQWLDSHPRLRVATRGQYRPLAFYGPGGRLRGITADMLAQISLRTGLKFDVVPEGSIKDLNAAVERGDVDLLASDMPSSDAEGSFYFTRPYLTIPFVMVGRQGAGEPVTLDQMDGKTLVLISQCKLHGLIASHYPRIKVVDAPDPAAAAEMVVQGKADAAALTLLTARHFVDLYDEGKLQITSTIGQEPASVSFATAAGNYLLLSVLNKAMLSISPEESAELDKRWRNDDPSRAGFWQRHGRALTQGFVVVVLMLLAALLWNTYLRQLIRKRKQAEDALTNQMMFMRVLIDGTPHPIYVRDRQGRLVLCNSAYLEVMRVEREFVLGKTLLEASIFDAKEAGRYHQDYLRAMEFGEPSLKDSRMTLPSGAVTTIYHWILPYRDSEGGVVGMIGGWLDVGERQYLLEQLKEAKESADNANRAKTTFLATMSHEIRTPINAVTGMLELASKKAEQGQVDHFALEVASVAAQDLLELIGDILDIARIESGHLNLAPERANPAQLVQSVVRMLEGLARQKQLTLTLDMDPAADRDVSLDPTRFKQILSNLLSNAIKFTARGGVDVRLRVGPDQGGCLAVSLSVEDTGEGISEEDQRQLFSPFSQASNNRQSARSGTGLGLVICKTLCEMMGGQLTLSSVLGQGTQARVRLCLPLLEPVVDEAPETERASDQRSLNVLIVDDYLANRALLKEQLTYLGHQVRDACDGAQGLACWREGGFDVVITDCNMANMNGYELTQAIREQELATGAPRCRVLGFTANAQPEERARCAEAGMDDCLFKPVSLDELEARLLSVEPWSSPEGDTLADCPVEHLELANIHRLAAGNMATVVSLLDDLLSSYHDDLGQLLKLFTRHDLPGLAAVAHRVKGGARIIAAMGLILCCDQLESACGRRDDALLTAAVDGLYAALEDMIELLEDYREDCRQKLQG